MEPTAVAPPPAPPDEPTPTVDVSSSQQSVRLMSGSIPGVRELSQNVLLLPKGDLELGGAMTFLTSGIPLREGGKDLVFTDVGLLTLNSRYSFGPVELAAAIELLVKQPGYTDEYVPQVGSLTGRVAIGEGQAATLHFAGGPLLDERGIWGGADLAVEAKRVVHETLVFQGSLGGSFTHLRLAEGTAPPFWFSEVVVAAETVLRTPHRAFAVWIGAELRVPVAANPDAEDGDPAGYLDPQTRLNVYVGGAYSFVDRWDLYARFAFVDRGEEDNPQSMLPILDGGFDQQQTTFGLIYRWELGHKAQIAAMAD